MADNDLQDLVRRRLWELSRSPEDASRGSRWVVPPETIQRMARAAGKTIETEGLSRAQASDIISTLIGEMGQLRAS